MNNDRNLPKLRARQRLRNNTPYYVMLIIPVAFFVIFKYWPMFGLSIAFQNYKAGAPFLGGNVRWVGLRWRLVKHPSQWRPD